MHSFISVDRSGKGGEDDDRAGSCHFQRVAREREHRGISFFLLKPVFELEQESSSTLKNRDVGFRTSVLRPVPFIFDFSPLPRLLHTPNICSRYTGENAMRQTEKRRPQCPIPKS